MKIKAIFVYKALKFNTILKRSDKSSASVKIDCTSEYLRIPALRKIERGIPAFNYQKGTSSSIDCPAGESSGATAIGSASGIGLGCGPCWN